MTTQPAITPELVKKHNLTPEEYDKIKAIIGREPTYTELGIFSVMWSEHCSYKNTRPLLKTFPTKSPKILVGAGEENAGIIDIGDNLAIAFKIESHNHPSAVEPFQGAATGVGGIVRDIFTMGARPICALNSLRFGELTSPEARRLFSGVVAGIAHYGNCFGIPTIAGEVYFDKSYEGNPLVNAFCLGVLRHEQIARGAAKGIGNPVFYVGPATGRDGLAGAAFASQDLTEQSADQQRGAVQVGDPFMAKLVMEARLELLATGAVAGIQDMGAAGLTCSTCETAARAGTGIEIELSKVPQRAANMTPYEIMLSESQERMLIIVKKGREAEVQRIFDKWDLPWAQIGTVTETGRMVVKNRGQVGADIPAKKLAEAARNQACSGDVPLGTTDNLNFGNPHNPEIFYQLKESVRGVAEACRIFNAPVTGGNVSLYNQNPDGAIDPTPTIAMVGIIQKPEHITTQWFKDEGDAIILFGEPVDKDDPLL